MEPITKLRKASEMKEATSAVRIDQVNHSDIVESSRDERGISAQPGVVYRGLCSTCNHSTGCKFRRDPERPVLFCEEFDSYSSVKPSLPNTPSRSRFVENLELKERMGLCINCDRSSECAFPGAEVGVWHCEEYE
jgi:hypothetical protein